MEKVVSALVGIVAIPLVLLNIFGWLVAGIWLVATGDWSPLLFGLLFMFLGFIFISILMLPVILFSRIGIFFTEKKNSVGTAVTLFIMQTLLYSIIFGVSYYVFGVVTGSSNSASVTLALLVWSFAVAVAPWTFMASKEQDNEGTQFTLFAAQTGLLIVILTSWLGGYSIGESFNLVVPLMLIPILVSTWYAAWEIHNSGEHLLINRDSQSESGYTHEELTAYVVCMLHIAASDGHLHQSEIEEIRQGFRGITDERISRGFVKRIYDAVESGELWYEDILQEASHLIGDDMKENIIVGAYLIAKADGQVTKEERKEIALMGEELGMSKKEVLNLLNDAIRKSKASD